MHILASTTRQWNCGDEFILMGCRNLCEYVWGTCDWAIFNRNPEIKLKQTTLDNSWRSGSLERFDKIVVAGSLEWFGQPLFQLFKACHEQSRQVIFLGIGYPESDILLSKLDLEILKKSTLIVCRDTNASTGLQHHRVNISGVSVCPAFFASKISQIRTGRKVACAFQSYKVVNQNISQDLFSKTFLLSQGRDIICHYIDEYLTLPGQVRYSYDAQDYLRIYNDYDIVVSTRLHGAILAMSLGIPAILVAHGGRHESQLAAAASQFPMLSVVTPDAVEDAIENMDVSVVSEAIIAYKERTFNEYVSKIT